MSNHSSLPPRPYASLIAASILTCLTTVETMAGPALIQAGPMVGHVSEARAQIWLRLKQGARLEAAASQGEEKFQPVRFEDLGEGFLIVHFAGLKPGTATTVRLSASRQNNNETAELVQFNTAPVPRASGRVRVAFGSCSKVSQFKAGPIYQAIADAKPDLAIFVGDNSYFIVGDGGENHFGTTGPIGDWTSPEAMMARHLITRVHPDLQRMLRSIPCYAVWDDHDYGPNNADVEFELKEEAMRMFRRVWANPSYGISETPGIFSSFRHGPVEIFLMDDRWHKYSPQNHKDVTTETGVIWGEGQLDWLLAGLKASTAPIKLIANGTQFLSAGQTGEGHFQEARGEQRRLLSFLAEQQIGGVVFLTGDRHFSEANQQTLANGKLVLEFTSSPLQQGQLVGPLDRTHDNQLWGMRGNNFGLVTVNVTDEGAGTIRFETRDENNQVPVVNGQPCATVWNLSQLRN